MEKNEIYLKLTLTILAVIVYLVRGIAIHKLMKSWRGRIKDFIDREVNEDDPEEKRSRRQSELIKKRAKDLNFITSAVTHLEIIVFGMLTVLLLFSGEDTLKMTKTLGAFLGGWLTLKVLSSHIPWSDVVAGKAYYHASLFGTLFNVMAAITIGFVLFLAWK